MNNESLLSVKYRKNRIFLRKNIPDDYWVFLSIFYSNTYGKLRLRRDDVVLDAGANIGLFTIFCCDRVKRVIAIEPEPSNFKMLELNINENNCKNVILVNKAISNRKGYVGFSHTGGTAMANEAGSEIQADTLDDILLNAKVKPTIIKMDIEGFEGKAFKSFMGFDSVREIIMEIHSNELQREISSILSNNGFQCEILHNSLVRKTFTNAIKHPLTLLKVEKSERFRTLERYLKYLLHISEEAPVELKSRKKNSNELAILYAKKTMSV